MKSTQSRLDRFIRKNTHYTPKQIRTLLIEKRIRIDGHVANSMNQLITQFSTVTVNDDKIQQNTPLYFMLHKPKGVVSATKDKEHTTVIDIMNNLPRKQELHIAGRLDFNTSGLMLLTNDGHWSRRLSSPGTKTPKHYHVTLENPLDEAYIEAFARGMYFAFENITTQTAHLEITSDFTANLCLTEGRYHQVKRMFGAFQNKVLELHRYAVGSVFLDEALQPGEYRQLTDKEIHNIFSDNS